MLAYADLLKHRYVSAKNWEHLARLVRNSIKDSNLDKMVQLHFGDHLVERKSLFNVRRVVYNHLDDIQWLLKTDGSLSVPAGLRAEAPSFVPTGNPQHTTQVDEDGDAPVAEDTEDETAEHGDLEDIGEVDSADYATAAPKAPTPEEIAAHKTIVEAYRRYISLKRVNKKSSEEMRRRVFTSFSTEAAKMDWPHCHYRMLFLGPIPHLYIAVEGMKNHLYEARNNAKKRLSVVAHLELENVQLSLTQMKLVFLLGGLAFHDVCTSSLACSLFNSLAGRSRARWSYTRPWGRPPTSIRCATWTSSTSAHWRRRR